MTRFHEVTLLLSVVLLGCGSGMGGLDGGTGGGTGAGGGAGGGGSGSGNTVMGTINGQVITVQSSAAQRFTAYNMMSVSNQGLAIRLSEHTALCNPSGTAGYAATDKRMVTLRIDMPPDAGQVMTGQHSARLDVSVPQCNSTSSGVNPQTFIDRGNVSVTLTEVQGRVKGTFTGSVSSGASISGSFDADYCTFYDWEISGVRCGP